MSATSFTRPRSIALVGPYGSGKSTLFEALLAAAGSPVRRPGGVRTRTMSTEMRLGHCSYLGDGWSILDCPGSIEFSHETAAALAVVDLAVLVCDPSPARALTAAPLLKHLEDEGVPHIVFINKIDTLEGNVGDTIDALQAYSRRPLVLRQVPIREGEAVTGYVDVISDRAYRYRRGQEAELISLPPSMREPEAEVLNKLVEVLADHDDGLLEKVLEDVKPTQEEIFSQLHKDVVHDAVAEVLLGAAENENGVRRLWKALRHDTPQATETAERRGVPAGDAPLAQVFKTQYAGHTGKLSYARIWRGAIKDGATLEGVRLGAIYRMPGGEAEKTAEAVAGEIVALGRLEGVPTGATVSTGASSPLPFPAAPPPVYALAIHTADRKDDVKLSGALQRLQEEDAALSVTHAQDTNETILHGQGEIHLNAAVDRLAKGYNLKLTTQKPQVAFKETIRAAVHQHARLKRQTGGHGQFADVKIDIAPRERGEGFIFHDKIVGGAVPRQYIPAVGEAAEESARKGPFGYPVVDISVTLVDGTFHNVDSSDMAFKTATRMAMTEGLAKADPILLEPIERVTISVPNEYTPRAQRLLTSRRGQILGFQEKPGWPGWDDVAALVPEAELHDLIIELRSQTMGLGNYTHQFDHLAETQRR
jgi:elongation factor G